MLRGNGTRGLIVEELKLFLENHHVSWVNRLAMVIFESYVGLTAELTVVISMGFHSGDSW
jgi:DNA primase large subunit